MNEKPDFYMIITEYQPAIGPIDCYVEKIIVSENNHNFLKTVLHPGINKENDYETVILAPRHLGSELAPINMWPMYIYVCEPKDKHRSCWDKVSAEELIIRAWAELYETLEQAQFNLKAYR